MADVGPNSLPSTLQNVDFVSTGHLSGAISFNNSSSFLQITDLIELGIPNKPFSISLWIRPYSLAGTVVFVENGTIGNLWCISFVGFSNNGSLVAQMWNGTVRSIFGPVLSTSSVWYHIVQTWSPTNRFRLYVDDVLVGSDTLATVYLANSTPMKVKLGNRPNNSCIAGKIGPQLAFHGDIDDFRIYSRELTTDDIYVLYHYQ